MDSNMRIREHSRRQLLIEKKLFAKTNDEVIATTMVVSQKDSKRVLENSAVPKYYLVVTVNSSISGRKASGKIGSPSFGNAKLHTVKIKGPNDFSVKKSKALKSIEFIQFHQADSSSADPSKKSFSFTFSGGKKHDWISLEDNGPEFIWWLIEACRVYEQGHTPRTDRANIEAHNALTTELTGKVSGRQADPSFLNSAQRHLLQCLTSGPDAGQSDENRHNKVLVEKIRVPAMSIQDAADISGYLKEARLDIARIAQLESQLIRKLSVLENENIAALYDESATDLKERIAVTLEESLDQIRELDDWMKAPNEQLTRMKARMDRIEYKNQMLETQEHNHQRLFETLRSLLDDLEINETAMYRLDKCDFTNSLTETLLAARQLDQAIRLNIPAGLASMEAVRNKQSSNEILREKFSHAAAEFLESTISDLAVSYIEEENAAQRSNDQTSMFSSFSLGELSGAHQELSEYSELAKYLERLQPATFQALRPKYAKKFGKIYLHRIKFFFDMLKKKVVNQKSDSRLQSFPEFSLSSQRWGDEKQNRLPNPPIGNMYVTDAFDQALREALPMCTSELDYITDFFGLARIKDSPYEFNEQDDVASVPKNNFRLTFSDGHNEGSTRDILSDGQSAVSGQDLEMKQAQQEWKHEQDSLHRMMMKMFDNLEKELIDLTKWGFEMDPFYTLHMLVECEQTRVQGCAYFVGLITSLQAHLRVLFNRFIDEEIAFISSCNVSAKQAGILAPLVRFPLFVDRMEYIIRSSRQKPSQSCDLTYLKFANTLFKCIESVAASDEKYSDVVLMENYHYFWKVFSTRRVPIPALEPSVQKAAENYKYHLDAYVKWHVRYELKALSKFWKQLEEQLESSLSPTDIAFSEGLSKHDLRSLCKKALDEKSFAKGMDHIQKRILKHLPRNPNMVSVVWRELGLYFVAKFQWFETKVAECYQNEKLTLTSDQVQELFSDTHVREIEL